MTNKTYYPYILIIILSLIVYNFTYGFHTLLPNNVGWLLNARHDWGQHYLGWAFYRNSNWTFPLGTISDWYYPMGTNVGLTDSIPLLALIFKLFSPILGNDFQYFGVWLLSCFILNGIFAYKIFKYLNINIVLNFILVLFVITNPVLIYRGLHPALCAQWLILASIYLYIKEPHSNKEAFSLSFKQSILILLSGLIHPYLTFIVAGFAIILPFKNFSVYKSISIKKALITTLITFTLLIINWYIVGLIGNSNSEVNNGYGLYSWNFNSFFNPDGFSTFLPQLKQINPAQYEGYSYLGLGILILIPFSIILLVYRISKSKINENNKKSFYIFLLWLIPLTLFGITNNISYNDKEIFTYPIPDILIKLGNIFRATSRFIWLLYYTLFLSILIIFAKFKINNVIKIVTFSILLCIQLYDTKTLFTFRNLKNGGYHPPLTEEKWTQVFKEFDHIIPFPIYEWKTLNHYDYQDFGYLAAKNNKTITNAYVARTNTEGETEFKNKVISNLYNNKLEPNSVYITSEENLKNFIIPILSQSVKIVIIDNYFVIYTANKHINISQSIEDKNKLEKALTNLKPNTFIKTKETFVPIKDDIDYYFEYLESNTNFINFKGWVVDKKSNNNMKDSIYIVLRDKNDFYISKTDNYLRNDIGLKYNNKNLENAGFESIVLTENLSKGISVNYGILIKTATGSKKYVETDQLITIGNKAIENPELTQVNLSTDPFFLSIDKIDIKKNIVMIFGWSANESIDNENVKKEIILLKDKTFYKINTNPYKRDDVVSLNKNLKNANYSGFIVNFYIDDLPKGDYTIGVRLTKDDKTFTQMSNKTFTLK